MIIKKLPIVPFILIITSLLFLNCSKSSNASPSTLAKPKIPYCGSVSSYSKPVTITGKAVYEFRINGNGAIGAPNPIRRAEVRVTTSNGKAIQCGETDESGNFSLTLPKDNSTVTITVTSRANNQYVKAYVMNNPTLNEFYGLSTKVSLTGSKSVGTLTAPATGSISGGAFNILDKVLDANDFLRTETAGCSAVHTDCREVSVAPIVDIFWAKGVNPGEYFGLPALSFYIPDDHQLFILGGENGDVDNSDTDHFDNSIILHEYGHVIESQFSIADSPGGSHNGDNILDPRLAWGEGWANYFQAAVTGIPVYRDTYGTPNGTNGIFINADLEDVTLDVPTEAEEGNFREFSVTRALWDITDPIEIDPSDDLQSTFAELWTIFAGTTNGLASTNHSFRSLGLFYELQAGLATGENWSTIQSAEEQIASRKNYANTLSNGAACPTTLLAEDVPGANPLFSPGRQPEDGSPENSNQFKSNDFYQITHAGGPINIAMTYTTTPGNAADLDMYLYKNDYIYGSISSGNILGMSENTISIAANNGSENISIGSLAAGTYMLNIVYDTTNGIRSAGNYRIFIGTEKCPD